MEYKPATQGLIKSQQRAAITWIITLQMKHFFRGESNQLTELILMKNNLLAKNPMIYQAEVPLTLYRYDPPPCSWKKHACLIERTSLWKTASATRRPITSWKYMTSLGSTSPMAFGKSICLYASGIWQASTTSKPHHYQRTTRYATLSCSINAPSTTSIRLISSTHMKKPITGSIYWKRQSIILTRSRW